MSTLDAKDASLVDDENEMKGGLDDEIEEDSIDLISQEGKKFSIPRSTAIICDYIKGAIDLDSTVKEIPLKHVKSEVLEKLIEWMNYHKKIPPRPIPRPLKSPNLKEICGSWDANFIDCDLETVFEVLLVANFLNMGALVELCCARVAAMMLGKTPKQIRKTFNIKEDFTPEEENEIRKEFAEFL